MNEEPPKWIAEVAYIVGVMIAITFMLGIVYLILSLLGLV